MNKEIYEAAEKAEGAKEFLKKWGTRIGLIAIGLIGLSFIL